MFSRLPEFARMMVVFDPYYRCGGCGMERTDYGREL